MSWTADVISWLSSSISRSWVTHLASQCKLRIFDRVVVSASVYWRYHASQERQIYDGAEQARSTPTPTRSKISVSLSREQSVRNEPRTINGDEGGAGIGQESTQVEHDRTRWRSAAVRFVNREPTRLRGFQRRAGIPAIFLHVLRFASRWKRDESWCVEEEPRAKKWSELERDDRGDPLVNLTKRKCEVLSAKTARRGTSTYDIVYQITVLIVEEKISLLV